MKKRIIVVGNGMVGYKFVEQFLNEADMTNYEVMIFGEEYRPAYDRVHLSEYFKTLSSEALELASESWYGDNQIDLKLGKLIIEIDPKVKNVKTNDFEIYTYDYLVIATGSAPFVPTINGVDKKGVFVYRTIEDLDMIISYGKKVLSEGSGKAAIMGGGLLGLEAAKAVKEIGLETCVVEFAPWLMPRQLDEKGGAILKDRIEELGIKIWASKSTSEIAGNGKIEGIQFKDDHFLDVEMLVISAGIRARDELGKKANLELGPRGGIVVNEFMETSVQDIYAIGEVAAYKEMTYGLVAPGYDMAKVAVDRILGGEKKMAPYIDMSTKLKLLGVDVASFGDATGHVEEHRSIVFEDKVTNTYKRLNISLDGSKLLGGMLVGNVDNYDMLLQLYLNEMKLPANPEQLIMSASGAGNIMGSVLDLPDSASICSCESVTKGEICGAIENENCDSMKTLCKQTKAGMTCGGCKSMVKDILTETLKKMGREVKEVVCEHFPYARREIFDLVKFKGIKTYNEALDEIGVGHGCETCKPALASVFATVYNETAVEQESIQDTNDRFLANIQRNGTYSVVPRVPGGEITAEKLIVLGQVAKKYDLYTKITGGQRIDLFGAKVEELPDIWKELLDAGFESGHAYGKALRTVKSCVGSTWCRFGLDESVSFAITLENRYKGIRSPHKLKGGVSGCIRECAEARCKDFGVIATEHGWNLYVCGNGGANPKHAELLIEGVSNEECIKYVDRFLSFYIQTAPPLTRTAAWLAKLEGGIGYLREVVVDDSLGIATDLEAHMLSLVGTYKDEWRQVVESPELQKRYKPFINTDETDETIKFIPLRDQKMPVQWK